VTGALLKLALDSRQSCMDVYANPYARLRGYIRINSSVPIDYAIREPLPLQFIQVTGATVGSAVESNEVTVKGINVTVPITVSGGEYSIDAGPYTSVAGTDKN
jgi:hypothetical protein